MELGQARGRKSTEKPARKRAKFTTAERRTRSKRMKAYWAAKRKEKAAAEAKKKAAAAKRKRTMAAKKGNKNNR